MICITPRFFCRLDVRCGHGRMRDRSFATPSRALRYPRHKQSWFQFPVASTWGADVGLQGEVDVGQALEGRGSCGRPGRRAGGRRSLGAVRPPRQCCSSQQLGLKSGVGLLQPSDRFGDRSPLHSFDPDGGLSTQDYSCRSGRGGNELPKQRSHPAINFITDDAHVL
jgi:hypothetical protein